MQKFIGHTILFLGTKYALGIGNQYQVNYD